VILQQERSIGGGTILGVMRPHASAYFDSALQEGIIVALADGSAAKVGAQFAVPATNAQFVEFGAAPQRAGQ
jgi:hypothetical protein